ncbi:hypothetical protein JL720_12805 [Aureococcus anophagefferens]|nr:hypothetical protein JL720_12805 [Aureococcus anophagefferens]
MEPSGADNPVNRAYEQWRARTPTVCRCCALGLAGAYGLSWVADLGGLLATTPFYVVRRYQVYRLLLSPLSLGSVRLLWTLVAATLAVNGAFCGLAYAAAAAGALDAVLWTGDGAWAAVLALGTLECLSAPEATRRLLCLPVAVPRVYYPAALLGLFSLFNGVQLDLALGVAYGYADDAGYLALVKPSPQAVARCEASPLFAALAGDAHFVAARARSARPRGGRSTSVRGLARSSMAAVVVASRAEDVVVASRAEEPRTLGAPARAEEMGQATSTSSGAASWRYVQGSSAQGENAQGEAGKSINAKALDGTAPEAMSTLLHAAYGSENYPNYLLNSRARAARDALAARDAYVATYAPKHAYLRAPTAERALCASARAALAGRGDWAVRAELPGDVFSFPLLREDFCRDVAEECAHYLAFREAWVAARGGEAPPGTPGAAHRRGGRARRARGLPAGDARPLIRRLFPAARGRRLSYEFCTADAARRRSAPSTTPTHTVGYGAAEDAARNVTRRALIPHTDDAEVTLNVCLGAQFAGGRLKFHGLRTPATVHPMDLPREDELAYAHELGRAVLHRGAHFHEVEDVTSGARHVLICWFKSWAVPRPLPLLPQVPPRRVRLLAVLELTQAAARGRFL